MRVRPVTHVLKGWPRTILTRGHRMVQQEPDLLAGGLIRPAGFAQGVPHFVGGGRQEIGFQGIQQCQKRGRAIAGHAHGHDQARPWRSMARRIRRRAVSYSTSLRSYWRRISYRASPPSTPVIPFVAARSDANRRCMAASVSMAA